MNRLLVIAVFIAAISVLTLTQMPDLESHWKLYKETFKKEYNRRTGEELNRRLIWEKNLKYIENHNKLYDLGQKSFRLAINKFSDLTNQEFREKFTGFKPHPKVNSTNIFKQSTTFKELPSHVDWREKGVVTEVKNQGQCGACWAFSATGSVEAQHALKTGELVSLSEQNLIDCIDISSGCFAGSMTEAFKYIIENKGIDTEESYPYEAKIGECRFKPDTVGATIKSYKMVERNNEDALQQAVAQIGPISVAIDATHDSFQYYSEGIYDDAECTGEILNIGVLLVGYGTENGLDYWLVKNSWGQDWGMDGYVKMSRKKNNQCGIAGFASYPIA